MSENAAGTRLSADDSHGHAADVARAGADTAAAVAPSGPGRAPVVASATAAAVTLGLAAGCWLVTVGRMDGMDMGVATRLGSVAFFAALWVPMMAAMMLPGAAPAIARRARSDGGAARVVVFAASYLAVWALTGVAVYALYRPHGSLAAGILVVAAGLYELTPLKRACRRRCRENVRSGLLFGLCCAGSSAGLMVILVSLGLMSITWMSVITVLVLIQKLLPARAAIDVPIALAIVSLGLLITAAPSVIPGLVPPM
jgi:predicted metal-binding membrane protein